MSNKVAIAARAAALVACVVTTAVEAQTPKDLVIRLRYVTVEDRLRPDPESDLSTDRSIVLKLSTSGAISETYGRGNGRWYREFNTDTHLGGRGTSACVGESSIEIRWSGPENSIRTYKQLWSLSTERLAG